MKTFKDLKIIFMGTPGFSVPILKSLYDSGFNIEGVVTNIDKPRGRKKEILPSPIKALAISLGLVVYQPNKMKGIIPILENINPDLIVVSAYGRILPSSILNIPLMGCINVHASLLPHLRGAVPIPMAILNGDTKGGITFIKMDEDMDTGDMLLQLPINISNHETTLSLTEKLSRLASENISKVLLDYSNGKIKLQSQDNAKATYCYISDVDKSKALIDWSKHAVEIDRMIRAFYPQPLAYMDIDGKKVNILKVSITDIPRNEKELGSLYREKKKLYITSRDFLVEVSSLQIEGKNVMSDVEYLSGYGKYIPYL